MSTGGKLKINDLKYIVMEGGGARGATYLGAIRELERQLGQRVNKNGGVKARGEKSGIMDFLNKVEVNQSTKEENDNQDKSDNTKEEIKPIIEGVAGASAGAITTFALVLGLNSEEIKEVLKFEFFNFLSEVDDGKYRMIDENSQLAVGEDDKIDKATDHATLKFARGKGLGLKKTPFKYNIDKDKTTVTGSIGKGVKRELLFNAITKIIIDGALYNLKQIMKLFSSKNENNWYNKLIKFLFGDENKGEIATQTAKAFAMRAAYSSLITGGLLALFNIKSKNIKITPNTVMAIFTDRGMFSGFAVREFFFDLMIFAATKDTYFQKQLITFFNNPDNKSKYHNPTKVNHLFSMNLTSNDFINKTNQKFDFQIGKRSAYSFTDNFKKLLNHLEHITFREFYNILGGVEYACSVSNFTTNSPLYFSDKYTPNARVLEAVASSMSIPPAIRPVYNAGDVLLTPRTPSKDKKNPFQTIQEENIQLLYNNNSIKSTSISVVVNGEPKPFVKVVGDKVSFKKSDYELYEYAFKKGFQKYLLNRDKGTKVYVDTNNLLEINTFLDEMQKLLVGIRPNETRENVSEWTDQKVDVNGDIYTINLDLMRFFYNAQFKGLLLDGGYFNNIPFNFFREKGDPKKIDGVLPIKLDGHFPPDFLNSLDQSIAKFKVKVDDIMQQIEREELVEAFSVAGQNLTLDTGEQINLQPIYNFISLQFNLQIAQKSKKEIRLEKKTIRKIVKEWYKYYGAHNNLKPWEIPRPILDIAFTGYSYGAKRGQIRDISDHNNIIPLYDYGVSTYDFDLDKVKVLVDLAQHKAEIAVKEYFEKP